MMARKCICPDGFEYINGKCVKPESLCKNGKIYDIALMRCVCPLGFWENIDGICILIPTC